MDETTLPSGGRRVSLEVKCPRCNNPKAAMSIDAPAGMPYDATTFTITCGEPPCQLAVYTMKAEIFDEDDPERSMEKAGLL